MRKREVEKQSTYNSKERQGVKEKEGHKRKLMSNEKHSFTYMLNNLRKMCIKIGPTVRKLRGRQVTL